MQDTARVNRWNSQASLTGQRRLRSLLLLVLLLLLIAAVVAAETKFSNLVVRSGVGVETELTGLLVDLGERELGHVVSDAEGHALLDVGLGVDDVNFLKLTASGLDEEEVRDGNTDEVDESKEEVHTPGRSGGEEGSEHDDREVGDPVGAGRGGGTGGTGTERVDLGRVDPGERQEGEGEEDDEEQDTDDGTLGILLVILDQTGHGDDERETLAEETDEEELATADLLDHEERRDGGEGVDGREDTTHGKSETVFQVQVLLEEQGRVVDGSIAAGELLEELAGAAEHAALELLGLAESEEDLETGLAGLGHLDIRLHEVVVGKHGFRVRRVVLELGEDLDGLRVVAAHDEPTGGVGEEDGTGDDDEREQDLESDGEPPLHRLVDVGQTEDDPVSDQGTDGDHGTLEADEKTTVVRGRTLRLPDGDGRGVEAVTDSGDDTADNELPQTPMRAEAGAGDDGTDNEDGRAADDNASTTDFLTIEHRNERAKETTDFVASSDCTTQDVDVSVLGVGIIRRHLERLEFTDELGSSDDTRHHTLIVAEERETHDGCEGDKQVQGLAPKTGSVCPHLDGMRMRY